MDTQAWIALIGLLVTVFIALGTIFYRLGHQAARVEELEKWRVNMRTDMHEISEKIEGMVTSVKNLFVLVDERTERRRNDRDTPFPVSDR